MGKPWITKHVHYEDEEGAAVQPVVTLSGTVTPSVIETTFATTTHTLIVTISGAIYDATLGANNSVTTDFINAITSNKAEFFGFNSFTFDFNNVTRDSDTQATLTMTNLFLGITESEVVMVNLPASVFQGPVTPPMGKSFTITNTDPVLVITGTALTATKADIIAGGKTLIFTLTGCNWLQNTGNPAAGDGPFTENRLVIDSITGPEWTAEVSPLLQSSDFSNSFPTQFTLTLPAVPGYDATDDETINVDMHAFTTMGEVVNLPNQQFTITVPNEVEFQTGTFSKSTAGAPVSQDVALLFDPKVVILYSTRDVTPNDTVNTHSLLAIGFSEGTTEKSIWASSEDGQPTSNSNRFANSTKAINLRNTVSGALSAECDLTLGTLKFSVNWTTNNATAFQINFIAIGGAGIEGVDIVSFLSLGAIGVQKIPSSIANGDFIFVMGDATVTEDALDATSILQLGMASSPSNQGGLCISSQDAQATSNTQRTQLVDTFIRTIGGAGTILNEGKFAGFTDAGADINWISDTGTARRFYALIVKGGNWLVGKNTFPTSITTKTYPTLGTPKGLIAMGFSRIASSIVEATAALHLGAADGTNESGITVLDRDNLATTDAARLLSATRLMPVLNGSTAATADEADLDSFNAGNFILDHTKNAGTAKEFISATVADGGTTPASMKVMSFDQSATNPEDFNGAGFKPKAAIIISSDTPVADEDDIRLSYNLCIGISDGVENRCVFAGSPNGSTTSNTFKIARNNRCMLYLTDTGTPSQDTDAHITAFIADGFTMTYAANASSNTRHTAILFGGDGIIDCEVGQFQIPVGTGEIDVASRISHGDFLMLLFHDGNNESNVPFLGHGMGFADKNMNQGTVFVNSTDNSIQMGTYRQQRPGYVYVTQDAGGVHTALGEFIGFTSTGFKINMVFNTTVEVKCAFLIIKGGNFEVGKGTMPTTNTTKAYPTKVEPKGVMIFGNNHTASDAVDTDAILHFGATDGTTDRGIGAIDEGDLIPDSKSSRYMASNKIITTLIDRDTVEYQMELDSLNAADFTLNRTAGDAEAKEFIWASFSDKVLFHPTDLSGLALWLCASNFVDLDTGDVTDWRDKTENDVDFDQTTGVDRPLLVEADLNSKNGIQFDGGNEYLTAGDVAAFDAMTKFTCSFVFKPTAVAAGTKTILSKYDSTSQRNFIIRRSAAEIRVDLSSNGTTDANGITSTTVLSAGTEVLVTVIYNGAGAANADRLKIFIDGIEETLSFTGTIPATTFNSTESLKIGAIGTTPAEFGDMTLYELFFYLDNKAASERALLEAYLNAEYNL